MARRNSNCCDEWEHQMPDGMWMCGRTHESCDEEGAYRYFDGECNTTADCSYGENCILGECV